MMLPLPPHSSRPRTASCAGIITALLAGALVLGCRPTANPAEEGPWRNLARGFESALSIEEVQRAAEETGSPLRFTLDENARGLWIETEIPEAAWERAGVVWEWRARNPFPFLAGVMTDSRVRLHDDSREYDLSQTPGLVSPAGVLGGEFHTDGPWIQVDLGTQAARPDSMRWAYLFELGTREEGVWRVTFDDVTADGIAVWPGQSEVREVGPIGASTLRFGLAHASVAPDEVTPGAEVRFAVTREDEPLFEATMTVEDAREVAWHEVPFPASKETQRLTFSLSGPPGLGLIVNPVIGPAEIGTYAERPWGAARPDLVLLMADTLRADSLGAFGSSDSLTPNLDRLAERALVFTDTWSTSTWTLPAQASLLTGLYPFQHGAVGEGQGLSRDLVTIAERLSARGYRTGAITDSLFVSHSYALDQGFQWFHETGEWNLRDTLAAASAFLDRDDGRPVFLFVHTYRTHSPYRCGPSEDETGWDAVLAAITERVTSDTHDRGAVTPAIRLEKIERMSAEFVGELRRLYDEGVRALDAEAGPWVDSVEARGLLDNGYLFFTSDHGEGFSEHGEILHSRRPYEEKIAIPLFFLGPGIEAGRASRPASLLDVTATLVELAGIPPLEGEQGYSLRDLTIDRPLFSFSIHAGVHMIAARNGDRKIIAQAPLGEPEMGRCLGIFDLEEDPLERTDLFEKETWERVWPNWVRRIEPLLQPVTEAVEVELDAATLEQMGKVGYGGE